MNQKRAEAAVRELLLALDRDVNSEGLKGTPRRVAKMLIEQCTDKDAEIDVTFSEEKYNGMVIVRNIPFVSMCEHHLVFFYGKAHVAYIPDKKVLGISKLARLVYSCSVGFTIQEQITFQIAERLYTNGNGAGSLGCMVVLEAEHGCMSLRGARAVGATTITSEVRGLFKNKPEVRDECLSLMLRGSN